MAGDRGADPGPANVTPGADDHAQHASPTVLCPQGHVNAWDYRFCERCGSPIGVVPWPSEESGTRQTAPARSFVPLVVLAATLLVVAVVVTAVGYAVTRPARNDREEPSSARGAATTGVPFAQAEAASCPDDPVLEAESIDLTSDGLAVSAASPPIGPRRRRSAPRRRQRDGDPIPPVATRDATSSPGSRPTSFARATPKPLTHLVSSSWISQVPLVFRRQRCRGGCVLGTVDCGGRLRAWWRFSGWWEPVSSGRCS